MLEKQIEKINGEIEEYETGYYSEKETRKRFEGMPEQTIEVSINEHRNIIKDLERTRSVLIKEEKKWGKYIYDNYA